MLSFESLSTVFFIFTFHTNYGRIFSRFDTIHERDIRLANQPVTARQQSRVCSLAKTWSCRTAEPCFLSQWSD